MAIKVARDLLKDLRCLFTCFSSLIRCFRSFETHSRFLISSELKSLSVRQLRPFRLTQAREAEPVLRVTETRIHRGWSGIAGKSLELLNETAAHLPQRSPQTTPLSFPALNNGAVRREQFGRHYTAPKRNCGVKRHH